MGSSTVTYTITDGGNNSVSCSFTVTVEDKEGPPNRAYLKLWEALVRLRRWPGPGERCLDLGASPGGWTYVLAKLGAFLKS